MGPNYFDMKTRSRTLRKVEAVEGMLVEVDTVQYMAVDMMELSTGPRMMVDRRAKPCIP